MRVEGKEQRPTRSDPYSCCICVLASREGGRGGSGSRRRGRKGLGAREGVGDEGGIRARHG